MALQTGLKLKLGQKLKLAPQLRQAIALLQLNRLELREHLEQALESNPLLELDAPEAVSEADVEPRDGTDPVDDFADEYRADDRDEYHDERWNDLPEGFSEVAETPDYDRFISDPAQESLAQHLLWQANLAHFSEQDEAIARAIIYALGEDGYLADDLATLRASLAPEYLVSIDEVVAVLGRVQHFEPVGVAARNLRECLLIQVRTLPSETPSRGLAEHLIEHYLDEVGGLEAAALARRTGFGTEEIDGALAVIRRLDPRPGLRYGRDDENYLVPDVYVFPGDDGWQVRLNRDNDPRLRLNDAYVKMIKKALGEDKSYLKERLKEAQWLISSLELRNHTLRSVAEAIVRHQAGFLEHGDIGMQPLLQKEIAERVDVHESTVSRATTGKFMHTPRGTFELKYFFSGAIPTRDGRSVSATAVKARLERLIATEPVGKPLSDQALVERLAADGLLLARRTVAKYREQLGIPNSARRRREARRP
ncbi:RNA polymerase factor sigma-54 [Wenzhouxiangella sp. XN79A]|uniref:RNA polymerase factor sigma-54 n=1 Tax=Wenzhouxiangella sp. XN79A TaxID=2724193 RepID=UPI00144AF404|nr:RNA polymerase factor sigma-54 [Wenzhouxiangella sp. XN79A]NKI35087.1 RNA polymerase factor sigma-54 [Wenzhouxiangella sp. XN79A]